MNLVVRLAAVVLSSGLALSLSMAASAADDPFIGTWVFNAAQSKGLPGAIPERATVTITDAGGGMYKSTSEAMIGGTNVQTEVTFGFDGKGYTPVVKPAPAAGSPAMTQTFERVDASTYKTTVKVGGQLFGTGLNAVSADGKTMTVTLTVSSPLAAVSTVAVFEKKK